MSLEWREYNIHIASFEAAKKVLVNLVRPFVQENKARFSHWHYLLQQDKCGAACGEVRIRFEGERDELEKIINDLRESLSNYANKTNDIMADGDPAGSHLGEHGVRHVQYSGYSSEKSKFPTDWYIIVEILQDGSEAALSILKRSLELKDFCSLQPEQRCVEHPYYLHLVANQLFIEP